MDPRALSRPRHEGLSATLEPSSAEKLCVCEGGISLTVASEERKRGEDRSLAVNPGAAKARIGSVSTVERVVARSPDEAVVPVPAFNVIVPEEPADNVVSVVPD
jgi:hypothetical protein